MKALVEKGYKKITPFFIPYAITNMGGCRQGHWVEQAPLAVCGCIGPPRYQPVYIG